METADYRVYKTRSLMLLRAKEGSLQARATKWVFG